MAETITFHDVPTDTDMQATLLPEPSEMFAFRNAFRVDNEAPNRDGDEVEYPRLENDFEGDLVEIEPDEEHPEARLTYDGLRAAWTEYGFKFRIRDKDIEDSKVNLVVINQQEMAREEIRRLDHIAGAVIEANRSATEIGTNGTDFNYDAAVDLETNLIEAGYDPGRFLYILSPGAWGGLAKTAGDKGFAAQTETFANELRNEGVRHGELLGHPAIRTNTGFMDGDDAYLIDTGIYGWESPRRAFDVDRWRDEDQRCWFYALNGRIDWVPTEPDAAIKAIGGVA